MRGREGSAGFSGGEVGWRGRMCLLGRGPVAEHRVEDGELFGLGGRGCFYVDGGAGGIAVDGVADGGGGGEYD